MLQVGIVVWEIAYCVAFFPAALCGTVLMFLSLGNQRWTNLGVNFWSIYPLQIWTNLQIIADHETGRVKLLAVVARRCITAAITILGIGLIARAAVALFR